MNENILNQLSWDAFDILVNKFRHSKEYQQLQIDTKTLSMRSYMDAYAKARDAYVMKHSYQLTNNLTTNF